MSQDVRLKSLLKTLRILELFDVSHPELGITEIAKRLGISKSNVHNIISTLESAGYVEKNRMTTKYRLSQKVLEFSYVVTSRLDYQDVIQQVMKRLSDETGEMIYFGVPHGSHVLYMFNSYPRRAEHPFFVRSIMGEKAPMYVTSLGKAMLSAMSDDEVRERIADPKTAFTPHTLIEDEAILEDVRRTRERGYAIDNVEHELGVRCVGVPILTRSGELLGALSVSGSSQTMTDERVVRYAALLNDAAYEIKKRI